MFDPFDWPAKDWGYNNKQFKIPITVDDFRILMDDELRNKITVVCTQCEGYAAFFQNSQNLGLSTFECTNSGLIARYNHGNAYPCENRLYKHDVDRMDNSALGAYFFVVLPYPDKKLYKLCLDEHTGKTAFHYVRESTKQDLQEDAITQHEKLREQVRKR